MSILKLMLPAAVLVAALVGVARANPNIPPSPANPYYPFASWESTGAPFEKCWWESGPSRSYRLCVPLPAPRGPGYFARGAWRY